MIIRALALTALLAATPAAAQTMQSQNPGTTPSSAGPGDTHQATSPEQDPTFGSQVGPRTTSKKTHRAKRAHRATAKPMSAAPGAS